MAELFKEPPAEEEEEEEEEEAAAADAEADFPPPGFGMLGCGIS